MSGAALTNDGLLGLVLVMTGLLVMFIVEIVRLPPELARPTEQPVLNLPEPPPPAPAAPAPVLPVRRPRVPAGMNGAAGQPGMTGLAELAGLAGLSGNGAHAPRHAAQPPPVITRPQVSGGPPWDPAPKPPGLDNEGPGRITPLSAGIPARPGPARPPPSRPSGLRKVAPSAP
jgi:hypothetical protein